MSNDISQNRSGLKEFLASIATISGDLSNITAPPFVLADNSTVEIPQYWADHPYLWAAPATEEDPEKRALLVLKNFLGSLRGQQYGGRQEEDGVKKPLNAFLGELFLGSWDIEELGETRLVSEQVGHHPPVTACYLWNDRVGIRAEGFTEQEITFSGNVAIKQMGYAIVHLDKYDEDYLLPLPNIKVKGLLSGVPHPELYGDYSLICSNGYISHIHFEGKSLLGSGQKNGFHARFFHKDNPSDTIYTIQGTWNSTFSISDGHSEKEIETFDVRSIQHKPITVAPLSSQDPWESRKAWHDVITALHNGDMKAVAAAKSKVETGQRQMRKDEEAAGETFQPIFFERVTNDPVFDKLVQYDGHHSYTVDHKAGIWKVDKEAAATKASPFHPLRTPCNQPRAASQSRHQDSGSSVSTGNSNANTNSDSDSALEHSQGPRGNEKNVSTNNYNYNHNHNHNSPTAVTAAAPAPAQNAVSLDRAGCDATTTNTTPTPVAVVDPVLPAEPKSSSCSVEDDEPSREQIEDFLRARTGNVR
ncbi:hypothetical protein ACJQWK_08279 [Exserohilum turcicum]